ncbi:MAG TPA: amino acid adenylation domain-containing protein, partial [Blastocatellia bacterium]|nr:amino acid adenylation domain-containing protein [Blastocatellia bacterium]
MKESAERIERLSPQKRALFRLLLDEKRRKGAAQISPSPRSGVDSYPLSFAQQKLWFLNLLEPGDVSYNLPFSIRLKGRLDIPALELSFNEIARRHESLRTSFISINGRPVQVIAPAQTLKIEVLDIVGSVDPLSEAISVTAEEFARPFDLTIAPLIRIKLVRMAEQDHIFLINMHHIISDGWSVGVLVNELNILYEAFISGRPPLLTDLPVQYADFALWQREHLQDDLFERQLSYWKERLEGLCPLELALDQVRPAIQRSRGLHHPFTISSKLNAGLREICRRHDATLFMVLLATFQTLLYRYSGQQDIAVGTPIAGRNRRETEGLIGFFLNTLVLRTNLNGDPRFSELLQQVREVALGAYAHQELPFEKLVEELRPQRDTSRTPLFQVMFVLHNAPQRRLELSGVNLEPFGIDSKTSLFDLMLAMTDSQESLSGYFEYNSDLFEPQTIIRMQRHFVRLLEAVASDSHQRISTIALLTEEEVKLILYQWNDTRRDYDIEQSIHSLFEEQVRRGAGARAVISEAEEVTYGELDRRANRLARHLRRRGVGKESLVGVLLERGVDLVVCLLGVLKAGGAYVPLDPEYPVERLEYMIREAGIKALVTDREVELGDAGSQLVKLKIRSEEIERESSQSLGVEIDAENLAYVIYTSGSTGKPKGVAITHRSAVALIQWANGTFTAEQLSGVLASTSVCFDLSVFEIFVTLSLGGKVIIAENALQLPSLPAAQEVTLINTVPSAMAEIMRQGGIPPSVKTVNLAGEALKGSLVQKIYLKEAIEQVYNLYGPSEDTTYSTFALMKRDERGQVSIGRPIWNTQVYVLDRAGQPVPVGVCGELYLGGDGLARGYLGRPDLTADRFLPDPFSRRPGDRLYRTGDLVRFLPGGDLDFIGRCDQQVKL